jgi:transcriptional regulator with XRE-family HTH domain
LSAPELDLDRLAVHLKRKLEDDGLSLRAGADEIGCSPATLSRLLRGSETPNYPEAVNLFRAVSWLGRSISDFEQSKKQHVSTIADVEVHLRALPGLTKDQAEALVAMVRAARDAAVDLRAKSSSKGSRGTPA